MLVLLYEREDAWHIPLTLRPDHLAAHAGQISLPGGLIEPGERSENAAFRELWEELGTPATGLELTGQLSPIYLFVSNYEVNAWVATVRTRPVLEPNPAEVAELLEVPLAHLLHRDHRSVHVVTTQGVTYTAPCFNWAGHSIWGATSMILAELVEILAEIGI